MKRITIKSNAAKAFMRNPNLKQNPCQPVRHDTHTVYYMTWNNKAARSKLVRAMKCMKGIAEYIPIKNELKLKLKQ